MGIRFNRETLRDKIYACWLGKNIGGTMGTPFEGKREINDIQGFNSPEGAALPNDDLDLQLVWLMAMNDLGPDAINSKVLGEYWMQYIGPSWNEYGVCKANMREGFVPPMSGSVNNDRWMHSNGAWIRTEIWACTHPGCVEKAIRLAFEDASVDHGFGEGSYAAIFVAAMESAAFVISDLRALLRIGLSKIPADCRVARSVGIVIKAFDEGIDWKTARNMVVEDSADLGWFQAPANIAFTVLGLLYGGGDFKKSMILAINCGDDTDCTGATLGSLMGIMYGSAAIPKDWASYIGDRIITVAAITGTRWGESGYWPQTCTELTDAVLHLIPACTRTTLVRLANGGADVEITDGADDFGGVGEQNYLGDDFVRSTFRRSQYSFLTESVFFDILTEFDEEPRIAPNGELTVRLTANIKRAGQQDHFRVRWYLPEGWRAEGASDMVAPSQRAHYDGPYSDPLSVKLVAGDRVDAANRVIVEVKANGRPFPVLIPLTIMG